MATRRKIKRSDLALELSARDRAPPQTADESEHPLVNALRSMWSVLLSVQHVGLADDFFMLGGDSLTGTRLLSQVKDVFGVALALDSLFNDGATVLGMARLVEAARAPAAE